MPALWDFIAPDQDLRRTRRTTADLVLQRTDLLRPDDKCLLELYLQQGLSLRTLARLTGRTRRSLARRIHLLLQGLAGPAWITIQRCRHQFTTLELDVAYDYFLRGASRHEIARTLDCGWRRANSICLTLDGFVRARLRQQAQRCRPESPPGRPTGRSETARRHHPSRSRDRPGRPPGKTPEMHRKTPDCTEKHPNFPKKEHRK